MALKFHHTTQGCWVIRQNMQNIVLINKHAKSKTDWPTKIILPFFRFSDKFLQDAYPFSFPCCDSAIVHKTCSINCWFGVQFLLKHFLVDNCFPCCVGVRRRHYRSRCLQWYDWDQKRRHHISLAWYLTARRSMYGRGRHDYTMSYWVSANI